MSQELVNLIKTVEVADYAEALSRIPQQLKDTSFFGHYDAWMFIAEGPWETNCPTCKDLAGQDFLGAYLRSMFPHLIILDEDTIYPNVHMTLWGVDTCKCVLRRLHEPIIGLDLSDADNLEPYTAEEIQL